MATLNAVPGTARVVVKQTLAGQGVANIFHVTRADLGSQALSQADVDDIASRFHAEWVASFIPSQTSVLSLTAVEVTDITSNSGKQGIHQGVVAGANGPESFPANVALCISWSQNLRYRGGHPRTYIAGVNRSHAIDARHFSTTICNSFTQSAQNLRQELEADWPLCLVKRVVQGVTVPVPARLLLTGESVNPRMDSQRRRLGRV